MTAPDNHDAQPDAQPDSRPDPRRSLGAAGEAIAARTLQAAGLTIVTRNWRCTVGEIDIVAQETGPDYVRGLPAVPWLVIVEVRTRRGVAYGTALQSIGPRKQARLRKLAAIYVERIHWRGPWRIDVVAVQMDSSGRLLTVEHIRRAVRDE